MRRDGAAILISLNAIDSHLATAARQPTPPTFQDESTLHVSEWWEGGVAAIIAEKSFLKHGYIFYRLLEREMLILVQIACSCSVSPRQ